MNTTRRRGSTRTIPPAAAVAATVAAVPAVLYANLFLHLGFVFTEPILLAVIVGVLTRHAATRWWTLAGTATAVTALMDLATWSAQRDQLHDLQVGRYRAIEAVIYLAVTCVLVTVAARLASNRRTPAGANQVTAQI